MLRRLRALALRARERVALPVTAAEVAHVVRAVRRELERPEPDHRGDPPDPRWRQRLDRELHDEVVDELLRLRNHRDR